MKEVKQEFFCTLGVCPKTKLSINMYFSGNYTTYYHVKREDGLYLNASDYDLDSDCYLGTCVWNTAPNYFHSERSAVVLFEFFLNQNHERNWLKDGF